MALRVRPGIAIAILLNLALVMGIPFFGDLKTNGALVPLIILALIWPWVMAWAVSRAMTWISRDAARRREEKERRDFV